MQDDNFYRELRDVFGAEVRCSVKQRRWVRNNIRSIVEEGQDMLSHAGEAAQEICESPMIGITGSLVLFAHRTLTGIDITKKEGWEKIFKNKTRGLIKKKLSGVDGVEVVFLN